MQPTPKLTDLKNRAAGFVSKALANTHPAHREALMVAMLGEIANGLDVLRPNGGAMEAYALADSRCAQASQAA